MGEIRIQYKNPVYVCACWAGAAMGACHSETKEYRLGRTGFGLSGLSGFFVFFKCG